MSKTSIELSQKAGERLKRSHDFISLVSLIFMYILRQGNFICVPLQGLSVKFLHVSHKNAIGEDGNGKPPHKIHFPRE